MKTYNFTLTRVVLDVGEYVTEFFINATDRCAALEKFNRWMEQQVGNTSFIGYTGRLDKEGGSFRLVKKIHESLVN